MELEYEDLRESCETEKGRVTVIETFPKIDDKKHLSTTVCNVLHMSVICYICHTLSYINS